MTSHCCYPLSKVTRFSQSITADWLENKCTNGTNVTAILYSLKKKKIDNFKVFFVYFQFFFYRKRKFSIFSFCLAKMEKVLPFENFLFKNVSYGTLSLEKRKIHANFIVTTPFYRCFLCLWKKRARSCKIFFYYESSMVMIGLAIYCYSMYKR